MGGLIPPSRHGRAAGTEGFPPSSSSQVMVEWGFGLLGVGPGAGCRDMDANWDRTLGGRDSAAVPEAALLTASARRSASSDGEGFAGFQATPASDAALARNCLQNFM